MTFYDGFLVGSSERIMIDNGLNRLKENIASGEKIQRTQWPPLYVKRDSVKNLWDEPFKAGEIDLHDIQRQWGIFSSGLGGFPQPQVLQQEVRLFLTS